MYLFGGDSQAQANPPALELLKAMPRARPPSSPRLMDGFHHGGSDGKPVDRGYLPDGWADSGTTLTVVSHEVGIV